jgi:hypothetical protein
MSAADCGRGYGDSMRMMGAKIRFREPGDAIPLRSKFL